MRAAFIVRSLTNETIQLDDWSDFDLLVVVSETAIPQFYPTANWLRPIN
jgi:hypothetical protein